ncbi:hypothetical protein NCAS_0C01980 [Naumovozyma castellii]|uniref:MADS-box domain-containing protein n=1 Tax=Naumovozyma castellii TaxID=27288 RepID=G0VCH8_NAUCA|nr:hypothetical protein NCAS_0C01980 [Naumovozyma castellii CBS 4309]CCC69188.1 hypothetical protein NCAS_0C01980 [Naumovozyma castellii CBS 4309]
MGRRKIEIQPITDERNRTVTFIKRKAGLFKKAHELAVLCQVDVAVIILGSNNTFYEFSSVDADELLKYYKDDKTLTHDRKDPSSYGDYTMKPFISLNPKYLNKNKKGKNKEMPVKKAPSSEEEEEDDEEGDESQDDSVNTIKKMEKVMKFIPSSHKRSRSEQIGSTSSPKRIKSELPTLNPLQQHVQRQFQTLYHMTSNDSSPTSASAELPRFAKFQDNRSPIATATTATSNSTGNHEIEAELLPPLNSQKGNINSDTNTSRKVKPVIRPVLRVQIPTNNNSSSAPIYSEPSSSGSPGDQLVNDTMSPSKNTSSTTFQIGKDDNSKSMARTPNTAAYSFSNSLPPIFSATSAFPQYIATPLQPTANGNGNGNTMNTNNTSANGNNNNNNNQGSNNPSSYLLQRQSEITQQHQLQLQQHITHPTNTERMFSPTLQDGTPGPRTNTLPSKFVHDLMMPSPNVSMTMFQDWSMGPNSAKPGNHIQTTSNTATSYDVNGPTGLTPYISNQTPLGGRYFNFPNEITEDKKKENDSNGIRKQSIGTEKDLDIVDDGDTKK